MKLLGIFLIVLAAALYFTISLRRRRAASPTLLQLRKTALTSPASEFGLMAPQDGAWAVVMDTAYPEGSASLVSFIDGSTSLYLSTGGGIIGGQAHESVANAAQALVAEAQRHVSAFTRTNDLELPAAGSVRFFIRSGVELLHATASEEALGGGQHSLSALFLAAQNVITELRLVAERGAAPEGAA